MANPGEFEIIEKYFAPLSGDGSFSLKDDAAVVEHQPGCMLVITQDAVAEGIHFFGTDQPAHIAQKALRVNLSDLAAKGATPKCFSLALGLGNDWDEAWVENFANGLEEDCGRYGITLNGGDTFKTGTRFVVSITAFGDVPTGKYVSRLGARPGDAIFVTGTIGDGALGLLARQDKLPGLEADHKEYLTRRYLLPDPRIEIRELVREFASAAMDVSDGLVGDLAKLCAASHVSANINADKIPYSDATNAVLQDESKHVETALTGGDDYEILFSVPKLKLDEFEKMLPDLDLNVTRVGSIHEGSEVTVFDRDGAVIEFEKTSYDHSEMKQ
ncbi:MAG: thiamine-phosphate kinase [Pseudomonadota bacterium]